MNELPEEIKQLIWKKFFEINILLNLSEKVFIIDLEEDQYEKWVHSTVMLHKRKQPRSKVSVWRNMDWDEYAARFLPDT